MFYLDNYSWCFKTEPVARCDDIATSICASGRNYGSIPQCTEQCGYDVLHLVPFKCEQAIFHALKCLLLNISIRIYDLSHVCRAILNLRRNRMFLECGIF